MASVIRKWGHWLIINHIITANTVNYSPKFGPQTRALTTASGNVVHMFIDFHTRNQSIYSI